MPTSNQAVDDVHRLSFTIMNATDIPRFPNMAATDLHPDPLQIEATTPAINLLHDILAVVTDSVMETVNNTLNGYFSNSDFNGSDAAAAAATAFPFNTTDPGNFTTAKSVADIHPVSLKVEQYVVPVVCALGVVLNVLNLLVLTERCLKESPYTYLTAMAILCLASLVISLIFYIFNFTTPNNYYFLAYMWYFYYPGVNICSNSTMWVTTMLTIERFLFVRHPLWARAKCDRRSAKTKVCVIIILMMLLNIPGFMQYRVAPHPDLPGKYHYELTEFRDSYTNLILQWIRSAIIQFIPMTILCVTNFYLVYAVHRSQRLRKRLQIRNNMEAKWSREQTRLTITLVAIVFFFIICIMPSGFMERHIAYAIFGGGKSQKEFLKSHTYYVMQKISNLLVFCQLSFNFILYSLFNDKFLAVFRRMLHRWADRISTRVKSKRNHQNNNSITNSNSMMMRLMRLDTMTISTSGGVERNGHGKIQLRASNNSMSSGKQSISSGKDCSQTKISLLEMAM